MTINGSSGQSTECDLSGVGQCGQTATNTGSGTMPRDIPQLPSDARGSLFAGQRTHAVACGRAAHPGPHAEQGVVVL